MHKFKNGDRVVVISVDSFYEGERGTLGFKGTVMEESYAPNIALDNNTTLSYSEDQLELVKENTKVEKLNIDTCDHTLRIEDGQLKVGCQTISGNDALTIASFLSYNRKLLEERAIKLGVWYSTNYGDRLFFKDKYEDTFKAITRLGVATSRSGHSTLRGFIRHNYKDVKEIK